MADAGADIIEIGVPFSDPIAEGVVIQEASQRALAAGCTADQLFDMVARLRGNGVPRWLCPICSFVPAGSFHLDFISSCETTACFIVLTYSAT